MKKKISITTDPTFLIRKRDTKCPVCRHHTYVIVQRVGTAYMMHTYVARGPQRIDCIHIWNGSRNYPDCLKSFDSSGVKAKTQIGSEILRDLIYYHNSNKDKKPQNNLAFEIPGDPRVELAARIHQRVVGEFVDDFN